MQHNWDTSDIIAFTCLILFVLSGPIAIIYMSIQKYKEGKAERHRQKMRKKLRIIK